MRSERRQYLRLVDQQKLPPRPLPASPEPDAPTALHCNARSAIVVAVAVEEVVADAEPGHGPLHPPPPWCKRTHSNVREHILIRCILRRLDTPLLQACVFVSTDDELGVYYTL